MLVWDVTCPDIFTPSYTSVEVGVVLAGQRMKTISKVKFSGELSYRNERRDGQ